MIHEALTVSAQVSQIYEHYIHSSDLDEIIASLQSDIILDLMSATTAPLDEAREADYRAALRLGLEYMRTIQCDEMYTTLKMICGLLCWQKMVHEGSGQI